MFLKIKKIILFIIIAGVVLAAIWYILNRVYSLAGNKIGTIAIADQKFYAEIVLSEEKLSQGLGDRDGLCRSCAMLFKFSSTGQYPFWMKDMRFPLDILWILDGKIVYLEKNVSEKFAGILSPPIVADQVLEINAGIADKLGVKAGDEIKFY